MQILSVLIAILIFGAIIFLHELGHFVAARIFGVTVKEFSIGMGPQLVSFTSKKTKIVYSLRMLPFGGFVSMDGEDEESEDENAFSKKSPWKRFIIVAAGGFMNLLTGFVIAVILVSNMQLGTNVIAKFQEADGFVSSSESGLREGDEIISVNGKRVYIPQETVYTIMHDGYKTVEVVVKRDGELIPLTVDFPTEAIGGMLYGVCDFKFTATEKTPALVLSQSFHYGKFTVRMIWETLGDLVIGRVSASEVSGPIGITSEISNIAASGDYLNLLYIAMLISINVGIVNLLPLPALDGGRLVFVLWEWITRKPASQKVEAMIHGLGFALLILLSIVIAFKDIIGLFG